MLKICIEKVNIGSNFSFPKYETPDSSGVDLRAAIDNQIKIDTQEIKLIPAGIKLIIPEGYEGQIRSRSGLALNHGITVLNSPGTIDSDYRGEIGIILINHSKCSFLIKPGMRVAQLVFSPVIKCNFKEINIDKYKTKRNKKGFGSTGINDRDNNAKR